MVKKIILHFWSARDQFIRYFAIGCSAFLLDVGTLYALKEHGGLSQTWSVVINQPVAILYVFLLNRFWSFRSRAVPHWQLVKFCLLAAANYFISVAWIWIVSERLGVYYLAARAANVALAVTWNFLLYKHWVYRSAPPSAVAQEEQLPQGS